MDKFEDNERGEYEDRIIDLEQQRDDLLFACKFAKAHIKKGSQKKALPILRAAIAKALPYHP